MSVVSQRVCRAAWIGLLVSLLGGVSACESGGAGDEEEFPRIRIEDGGASVADARRRHGDDTGGEVGDAGASCDPGEEYSDELGACLCEGTVCGPEAFCDEETGSCVTKAEADCSASDPWSPDEEAFVDASEQWRLPEIDADGVRLSVTDLEGDGWPDLVVRRVKAPPNRYEEGERSVWLLRNTGEGTFEDVTRSSRLLRRRGGNGTKGRPVEVVVWGDVDNDGDLDAYTGFNRPSAASTGGPTAEIMLNQGDGTFEFAPAEDNDVRRASAADMPSGASFVDYNRDGVLDLWVSQYGTSAEPAMRDQLYRGRGDGTFVRVTGQVGIDSKSWLEASLREINRAQGNSRSWSANACDLNGDGTPELLSGSYGRAPNHLWRGGESGEETVRYENISVESGYAYDDQTDWTDNQFARCYCELHPEAANCDGVPEPAIRCRNSGDVQVWRHDAGRERYRLGGNTGTTLCGDLNGDGELDLVTNEIRHWWAGSSSDPSEILYNTDDAAIRLERPGREATGLTRTHASRSWDEGDITGGLFDFDNDGQLDIYIGSTDYPGTRGLLYHQQADGTFQNVAPGVGIDHQSSHGIALADFDRDGDVDVVVGHSRTRCGRGDHCYSEKEAHVRLFENTVGQDRNWLQLRLVGGEGTNRSAIGARITVETEGHTQVREVGGGHGHYGIQHDLTQTVGLGEACRATVTVRWPDRALSTQTFVLKSGHRYALRQGGTPVPVDETDEP